MTTISHKNLTGTQLHENKGVAAASDNTVATASSGATVWQQISDAHVTATGRKNIRGALLHIRDQRSTNTAGQTYSGSDANQKVLQTVVTNEISGTALTSNQITGLVAGTYEIDGWVKQDSAVSWQIYLYNITGSATLVAGGSANPSASVSLIRGRFTLSTTSTVEIRVHTGSTASTSAANSSGAGVEVYADIMIRTVV